jgi:tetratricopeptide (TPR) repeat protein
MCENAKETNKNNRTLLCKLLIKEAEELIKLNEFHTATERLSECLENQPDNVEGLATRALTLAYESKFEEALTDVRTALSKDETHLKSLLHCIRILIDGFQDYYTAKRILSCTAQAHPNNPQVIAMAKVLKVDLTLGANSLPAKVNASADFLFISGRNALVNKQPSLALEQFNLALQADQNHIPSRIWRGNLLKDQGRLAEAKLDYDFILQVNPSNPMALFGLATCEYFERHYDTALGVLNLLIEQAPGQINALFLRGEILRKLCRYSESLLDFDRVIEFFQRLRDSNQHILANQSNRRGFARALGRRAYVKHKLLGTKPSVDKLKELLPDFEASLELFSDDSSVYNAVASVMLGIQDYERAQYYINESLKVCPNDASTLITAGRVYRAQKRFYEAEDCFTHAIRIKENDLNAHMCLVGVYIDMKSYQTALETIDKILSFHQDDRLPTARRVISQLVQKQFDRESAPTANVLGEKEKMFAKNLDIPPIHHCK